MAENRLVASETGQSTKSEIFTAWLLKYDNFCLRGMKNVINFSNTRTQWELFSNFLLVGFPMMSHFL